MKKIAPGFGCWNRGIRLSRLTVSAIVVLAVVPVVWALAGSPFEINDGNLTVDGSSDWESLNGSSALKIGVDRPTGQEDNSLAGKEDYEVPGITFGSIPNNKSNLLRFYVTHETVDAGGSDEDFLHMAWVRANTLGSANMDFEFNQSDQLSSNGITPVRVPGDMLITFSFSGGGNDVSLGLSRWTDVGPCEASSTTPCWSPLMALTGVADGSVNNAAVLDPIEGVMLPELTFGEASINLTAAGVFDRDECVTFGTSYIKSRSSTSFTSSMKDFIEPMDVSVTNCATITIAKNAVPDDEQDFSFDASPELGLATFDLDDDGDEANGLASSVMIEDRFEDSATVAERPLAGWDLTDVTCSGPATPELDGTGALTGEVTIDAAAGDTVNCVFTNTKRGRILVEQVTQPGDDPHVFEFELAGGPEASSQLFGLAGATPPHDSGTIRPGSYAVTQFDAGPEWDLTSATCDDGSPVDAVALDPGETVTCTFINTRRGRVVIDEVTVPAGDTQSFDFSLTGGPDSLNQSFGLTDAATPHDSGFVRPATYTAAQTDPGNGWDLSSATCDDGSPVDTIVVAPGETVVCTFVNTKRGRILVDQVTDPGGDPQVFDFSMTGGPQEINSTFGLTDEAAPHDSGMLSPGSFDVTQTDPGSGWDLTSAICDDGSSVNAVNLDPGETIVCTFVNTKRGQIIVDQVTDPSGDPQIFDFNLTGGPGGIEQSFGLTDDATPLASGVIFPGNYGVAQTDPGEDWDLASAGCDDGSPIDAVALAPGETVTCTFVNVKRGQIIVDEVTVPGGDPQIFDFDLAGGPDGIEQSFGLTDATEPHRSGLIRAGSYGVAQTDPGDGWDLTNASCDGGVPVDSVVLAPGATVTCTFVNTKRGRVLVDQVTHPGGDPQMFQFDLAGGPDGLNQSFGLTDAATPHDTGAIRAGIFSIVQQDPGEDWDPTSATCDDGSPVDAVDLAPGETITCTFVNTKRGRIFVDLVTDPSGDPQEFGGSLSGGSEEIDQVFNLTDTADPHDSGMLRPGTYAVEDGDAPTMWTMTSATCDDGSPVGAVALDPGETIMCTLVYVKSATLTIVKDALPDDPQDFGFTISGTDYTGGAYSSGLVLDDDDDPQLASSQTVLLSHGAYTVTEGDAGPAWDLDSLVCTQGTVNLASRTATLDLGAGDEVTCLFTNIKRGRIVVEKFVVNESTGVGFDPRDYPFEFNPSYGDTFWLKHGEIDESAFLRADTRYSVSEKTPRGWVVSSTCMYPDGSTSSANQIDLEPGAVVQCLFTNEMRIHPGSSGFWRNWNNHYNDSEFRRILEAALSGSPIYAGLFDSNGNLASDAIPRVEQIYNNQSGWDTQPLLREMTSTMLNLAVSKDPELTGLQNNDDICRDCKIEVSDVPGAMDLLQTWSSCLDPDQTVVNDLIKTAEATWTGLLSSDWSFDRLGDSELSLLTTLFGNMNHGVGLVVDPSTYPDNLGCLRVPGGLRTETTWFVDADSDGRGSYAATIQTCDPSAPAGYSATDDDCDDGDAQIHPDMTELCDGVDNDCDGTADSGLDEDGDTVDNLCDAFPQDATRSGGLHFGNTGTFDDVWSEVALPATYQDPVVIVGPPSFNDPDPGVVQVYVDRVSGSAFDVRFREWDYLDRAHAQAESASYAVMERGRYTMDDGSIWEWGTFDMPARQPRFVPQSFSAPFPGPPALFLTAQLYDRSPIALHAANVTADGFDAAMFQEEARLSTLARAEVGYLAIYSPNGSGRVTANSSLVPYLIQRPTIDHEFAPVLGWTVRLEEEQSLDSEVFHLDETLSVLALGDQFFSQDVSSNGWNTHALRALPPDFSAAMEWGIADGIAGNRWTTVPLTRDYVDPVVIVKPMSTTGGELGVIRLRDVAADSFRLRFQEWKYLPCCNGSEQVFYMVAESGVQQLAGLTVEAGTVDTTGTLGSGGWSNVALTSTFTKTPAVFASMQTTNGGDAAVTRITNNTATGFSVAMQEEENGDVSHLTESTGWIAIEQGSGLTAGGRFIEVFTSLVGSDPAMVGFSKSMARSFPVVLADISSSYDEEACMIRHNTISSSGVKLFVQEEQSMDAEMQHGMEDVSIFVAE